MVNKLRGAMNFESLPHSYISYGFFSLVQCVSVCVFWYIALVLDHTGRPGCEGQMNARCSLVVKFNSWQRITQFYWCSVFVVQIELWKWFGVFELFRHRHNFTANNLFNMEVETTLNFYCSCMNTSMYIMNVSNKFFTSLISNI